MSRLASSMTDSKIKALLSADDDATSTRPFNFDQLKVGITFEWLNRLPN